MHLHLYSAIWCFYVKHRARAWGTNTMKSIMTAYEIENSLEYYFCFHVIILQTLQMVRSGNQSPMVSPMGLILSDTSDKYLETISLSV